MAKKVVNKSSNKQPKPTPTSDSIHIHWWIAAFLGIFTFLIYANTLHHGFVLDDPLAIELNKNVTAGIGGIWDIVGGGYRENNFGGQLYRPISLIQFAIEWNIAPNNPTIHHFFNIFWYALSVVVLFFVTKQWFSKYSILLPMAISLIFAVHPIHTEVVANIKSRDEIMSLFFILISFYALGKYVFSSKSLWMVVSLILYSLALMSKESAITMFPVFGMLLWWVYGKNLKSSISSGLLFLIPVVLLLLIRSSIFGSTPASITDIMDNPIVSATGWGERFGTSMLILGKYILLQIFPFPLSSDYSYLVIPVVNLTNLYAIISLVFHVFMVWIAYRGLKSRNFVSLAIVAYFMAISLYSQIPLVIGTMFGERLAYLPSLWFISGVLYFIFDKTQFNVGKPLENISSIFKNNLVLSTGIIIISMVFSIMTFVRNQAWKDNYTLFTTDVATYPQSVRLNNGAADQLLSAAGREGISESDATTLLSKAEEHCNNIMKIKPVATAYLTLGNIRLKQKRYVEAIEYYDQVNDLKSIVETNKALAYREMGRDAGEKEQNITKSQEYLLKSLVLNSNDAATWYLMGVSYGVSGVHDKAAENFEKAYQLQPTKEYAKSAMTAYQYLGNQQKVVQYQSIIDSK